MTITESPVDRAVDALRGQRVSVGVWGCGHIGASAMYYFSRQGIRCTGLTSLPDK